MSTSATAIVTDGHGHFELMDVQLGDPHPGEVLVELKASGVPHRLRLAFVEATNDHWA